MHKQIIIEENTNLIGNSFTKHWIGIAISRKHEEEVNEGGESI